MTDKKNVILSYILSKGLFFGLGISYILNKANQNSGLAIIIGYIIGGIILYFINNKKDFFNKKIINKILLFIIITIIFITILLSFTVQTINFYLPQTNSFIIAFTFLLLIIYGASKSINSYKRLNELLLYIGLVLSIIGIFGNIKNIDFINYLPLFDHLDLNFIKAIFAIIILSITPIIILLSNDNNISTKDLLTGYFLGGLNILLLVSSTIGTLGLTLAKSYRYPEYIAFEKINFLNFIERIENILAFIWLIDLISIGILCLITIKNMISKNNLYIIFIVITYLTIKFFVNIYQNTMLIYHYIFYIYFILILLIILKAKKKE